MAIILQISHADDTGKTDDDKFIALHQVNSSKHSLSQKQCYFIRIYFMYNKSPYNSAHSLITSHIEIKLWSTSLFSKLIGGLKYYKENSVKPWLKCFH